MNRIALLVLVGILYVFLFGSSFLFWQGKFQASLIPPKLDVEDKDTITLLFVGDIMLDRGVEWYIKQHQDWKWPFLRVADFLNKADLVFGNLESVISDKGERQGSIYSFRADPRALEGLLHAGIDVVSIANNHSLDYGTDAFQDSLRRLQEASIGYTGGGNTKEKAHKPIIQSINGTTISILAYTTVGSPLWQAGEDYPGITWMDASKLEQLKKDIAMAKHSADIIVVSFHFGEEYQTKPSATQQLLSRTAIDEGASLVVGHHPHVVQPIEQYKHGWIAYSLGNFVFDQGFSKETMEGMMLKVTVQENSITKVMPLKVRISKEFQPAISKESM